MQHHHRFGGSGVVYWRYQADLIVVVEAELMMMEDSSRLEASEINLISEIQWNQVKR